ncbi:MAG TPA: SDR family oxidoreductase [Bacteroidales bacterium]|nr:SDR family oxidoreductase [Bacteroidales bacterium]HPT11026.1 SDR family oxidoreductase [Bacteroidales bacterium]
MKYLSNSRVLVTGGAGFIGSALCHDLVERGNTVVCLDNFATGKKENIEELMNNSSFRLIEGDIRNAEICRKAVEGVDVVMHEAALGSVPRSIANPATTNDVNVNGFLNMLIASRDAGVKRFVFASSSSVYGDAAELPKKEEKIGKVLSPYALTKFVNEEYARLFSKLYGIETIGLRYFNVFGRRQDPDGPYAAALPLFAIRYKKGMAPVINGDGSHSRDFTYVDNVILANNLAAVTTDPAAVNTVYNVACGERVTVKQLAIKLRDSLSRFDSAIAAVEPQYGPEREGDVPHSLASIEKARRLLGYEPVVYFHQGLDLAAEWYFNNCGTK